MSAIHVVTAANGAYIPHVGAMLHSLFSASPKSPFVVHFMHRTSLPVEELQPLRLLCEQHAAEFRPAAVQTGFLEGLPVGGWYIEEAWYRLVLAQVMADVDRALWLDADTIVLQDIEPLWQTELGEYSLAACPNALLYSAKDDVAQLGVSERHKYFNTGVLLMNMKKMREQESDKSLRQAALTYQQWIHFADQDVLNCVYHQSYKRLPLKWNFLTHSYINVPETKRVHGLDEYREARQQPAIVHFTGRAAKKPWSYQCSHPYRDVYLQHRQAAGFGLPNYDSKPFKHSVIRHLPLRLREFLRALAKRQWAVAKSYWIRW
jgi:lipopolysaccharide biosynthesis glycosyltransferase